MIAGRAFGRGAVRSRLKPRAPYSSGATRMNSTLQKDRLERFANLTFDDFRRMARDPSLSSHEKIGFPDEYRQGFETHIFADIRRKLAVLEEQGKNIADIGPGCAGLPLMMAELCRSRNHRLTWIDSPEMLAQLPDAPFIHKVPARFPSGCAALCCSEAGTFDAVLAYSLLHYVLPGSDIFAFLDSALGLLAPGGSLLIGDIPNLSKRNRFFASQTGKRFHRRFTGADSDPPVAFNVLEAGAINDAVILSLLLRARTAGFDAYVVPQDQALPMANRREDVLILRP